MEQIVTETVEEKKREDDKYVLVTKRKARKKHIIKPWIGLLTSEQSIGT